MNLTEKIDWVEKCFPYKGDKYPFYFVEHKEVNELLETVLVFAHKLKLAKKALKGIYQLELENSELAISMARHCLEELEK